MPIATSHPIKTCHYWCKKYAQPVRDYMKTSPQQRNFKANNTLCNIESLDSTLPQIEPSENHNLFYTDLHGSYGFAGKKNSPL
jgi:hypothetical protein